MSTSEAGPSMSRDEAEQLLLACPLHAAIGLELRDWEPGQTRFSFTPPPLVRSGEAGIVHGGALVTALDVAACFAAIAQTGHDCSTVDLRTDFLRPALDAGFNVRGQLRRAGRRLAWADATIHTLNGRLLATASGVFTWGS
jgi:uncharacterized protein (TIGR00369 family)